MQAWVKVKVKFVVRRAAVMVKIGIRFQRVNVSLYTTLYVCRHFMGTNICKHIVINGTKRRSPQGDCHQ